MTKRSIALFLLSVCAALPACAPGGDGAPARSAAEGLVITNPTSARPFFHDFGQLHYGEQVSHEFLLENREGAPVTIRDMTPSCSCTVPTIYYVGADGARVDGSRTQKPVLVLPAGATAHVVCAVDTKRVERTNIDKLAQVRVRSDSKVTPYITFEMHLVVARAFRAVPETLKLDTTPQSAGKTARVDVTTSLQGDPARIVRVASVSGPFEAALEEKQLGDHSLWIVTATAPGGLPLGPVQGEVVLETESPASQGSPMFTIPISCTIVPDIVARPALVPMTPVVAGEGLRGECEIVALAPGARVKVLGAQILGDGAGEIALAYEPVSPDENGRAPRWRLVATTKTSAVPSRAAVEVRTDDANAPLVRATLVVQPR